MQTWEAILRKRLVERVELALFESIPGWQNLCSQHQGESHRLEQQVIRQLRRHQTTVDKTPLHHTHLCAVPEDHFRWE